MTDKPAGVASKKHEKSESGTGSFSTPFVISIEIPAIKASTQVTFNIKTSSQHNLYDATVDLIKLMVEENKDDFVNLDLRGTLISLECIRKQAIAGLEEWQAQLKCIDEWKTKVTKASTLMNKMRDAYYKELFHLREQVYQQKKAEKEGTTFTPSQMLNFDPSEYTIEDDVARLLAEKSKLLEQNFEAKAKQLELKHEAKVQSLTEQLQLTKMMLSKKEQLVQKVMATKEPVPAEDVDEPQGAEVRRHVRRSVTMMVPSKGSNPRGTPSSKDTSEELPLELFKQMAEKVAYAKETPTTSTVMFQDAEEEEEDTGDSNVKPAEDEPEKDEDPEETPERAPEVTQGEKKPTASDERADSDDSGLSDGEGRPVSSLSFRLRGPQNSFRRGSTGSVNVKAPDKAKDLPLATRSNNRRRTSALRLSAPASRTADASTSTVLSVDAGSDAAFADAVDSVRCFLASRPPGSIKDAGTDAMPYEAAFPKIGKVTRAVQSKIDGRMLDKALDYFDAVAEENWNALAGIMAAEPENEDEDEQENEEECVNIDDIPPPDYDVFQEQKDTISDDPRLGGSEIRSLAQVLATKTHHAVGEGENQKKNILTWGHFDFQRSDKKRHSLDSNKMPGKIEVESPSSNQHLLQRTRSWASSSAVEVEKVDLQSLKQWFVTSGTSEIQTADRVASLSNLVNKRAAAFKRAGSFVKVSADASVQAGEGGRIALLGSLFSDEDGEGMELQEACELAELLEEGLPVLRQRVEALVQEVQSGSYEEERLELLKRLQFQMIEAVSPNPPPATIPTRVTPDYIKDVPKSSVSMAKMGQMSIDSLLNRHGIGTAISFDENYAPTSSQSIRNPGMPMSSPSIRMGAAAERNLPSHSQSIRTPLTSASLRPGSSAERRPATEGPMNLPVSSSSKRPMKGLTSRPTTAEDNWEEDDNPRELNKLLNRGLAITARPREATDQMKIISEKVRQRGLDAVRARDAEQTLTSEEPMPISARKTPRRQSLGTIADVAHDQEPSDEKVLAPGWSGLVPGLHVSDKQEFEPRKVPVVTDEKSFASKVSDDSLTTSSQRAKLIVLNPLIVNEDRLDSNSSGGRSSVRRKLTCTSTDVSPSCGLEKDCNDDVRSVVSSDEEDTTPTSSFQGKKQLAGGESFPKTSSSITARHMLPPEALNALRFSGPQSARVSKVETKIAGSIRLPMPTKMNPKSALGIVSSARPKTRG